MDRCRYPSKPCLNARALKLNGELHRFCEQHRRQANQNQMRWSKRKQTVLRVRRGDGGDDDGDELDDQNAPAPPARLNGDVSSPHEAAQNSYPGGRHGLHLPGPPPPAPSSQQGPPGAPHGHHNVNAAGASLSHLNLNSHGMMPPHPHPHPHGQNPNGGLISSFQDHMARGGAIPGTNGVNLVLNGGAVRRELAPAPGPAPHRGNGVHVPPIQTALPPLLPPRAAADQPDPSAVHALLMLERAANVVSSSSSHDAPTNDDDEDLQVRRELKRAKSNEWVARPTLSPAGLPTVASLVTHGMSSTTATASSSSSSSSVAAAASVIASVSSIGRSASWQPPVVREDPRESLGQWMQRKQASLPSLSNITRIEKRPYDSISSSAPAASSGGSFLHRGPENSGNTTNSAPYGSNGSGPPHHGPAYHAPLHPVSSTKSSATGSSTSKSEPTTADSAKRSALV